MLRLRRILLRGQPSHTRLAVWDRAQCCGMPSSCSTCSLSASHLPLSRVLLSIANALPLRPLPVSPGIAF